MMNSKDKNLPEYDLPPVNEVVIGLQFDPLSKFTAVHPGLFWQEIRDRYPKQSIQHPLSSVFEQFEDEKPKKLKGQLSQIPPLPRCWFFDEHENQLVQLQADRFIHNWKKVTGEEEYPHYVNVRAEFLNLWDLFLKFAKKEELGDIIINQWELTYVNYIFKGNEWTSMNDLQTLFSYWAGRPSKSYLPIPENIGVEVTYAFPEKFGRLHISFNPAFKKPDDISIIRLNLTARGRPEQSDISSILASFDLGHEWIVNGFTDFTTSKAHEIWKRKVKSKNG
ncbi:MAG: TIGR04255 family protein [Sedimentisphaerales bacterium]|nr:TIGR04255 family protein [Sedimentisphaerales bacterium]